ncbi:hypothetical protein ACROYT_G016695 [Oculina patagonica]
MEQKIQLLLVVLVVCAVTVSGRISEECFQRRLERRAFWRCCGAGDFYNPRTQICCGDKVYDLGSGIRCCYRNTPYNPSTQICCPGGVLPLRPGYTRCCGKRVYNPSKETCCGGLVVTPIGRCCGGKPYIPQTHLCCFGTPTIRPPQATSVRCCGRKAYDRDRNSCCRGFIRPLGYPCGCGGGKICSL